MGQITRRLDPVRSRIWVILRMLDEAIYLIDDCFMRLCLNANVRVKIDYIRTYIALQYMGLERMIRVLGETIGEDVFPAYEKRLYFYKAYQFAEKNCIDQMARWQKRFQDRYKWKDRSKSPLQYPLIESKSDTQIFMT
tara:strand:- start:163 stop:576 length:414 start_codon:yes stop_codon:yes gene_type:complete